MTWRSIVPAALAIVALPITATPLAAEEPFLPQTLPVALNPADPSDEKLGELTYRGGVVIEPGEEEIGGISGLDWHDDRLFAVSDDGRWLILTPDSIQNRLTDVVEIEMGQLKDERGKSLRKDDHVDAEAIALGPDGAWQVAFERNHRVWRYDELAGDAAPTDLQLGSFLDGLGHNLGIETLTFTAAGWFACAERQSEEGPNCLGKTASGISSYALPTPPSLQSIGGVPTGSDCASNGVCYVLFRSYKPGRGNDIAIVALGPDGNSEVLASWGSELTVDNFEGLAVREDGGKTYLYIISDDNFSDDQRTLLMKFEVSARAATAPGVPEKVFATQLVVLETDYGPITVSLETERAPVTAANFLRYVDEGRFDGIKCYRAMAVQGGEQPSGFLQCGTQNDPTRILDPIAHEPTNETGLSHTNGALSMARFDPGTATGDFSIMIRDQIGLDAVPDSDDPARRPGFAVFGYVVDGMEAVHAIHALPTDPDKGEGFLKGQLLAEPAEITSARRVETTAP